MYNLVMDLKSLENKKIFLFGKPRAFCKDEFLSQLKVHNIVLSDEYNDDISLLIEGKMMTPYEQNLSDELYENNGIKAVSIDIFEKELAKYIDDNVLLMSLKLSHDKDRLKAFIKNTTISDELFFKLIDMYDWRDEDFFENDDNRDVSAAFILRFYKNIERNHNVQFATTGFSHLVAQTKDAKLLEQIVSLEPIKYHPRIKTAIAMSEYCSVEMQKKLIRQDSQNIQQALSLNPKLHIDIVEEFLKDTELSKNVASSIELDDDLFEKLLHLAQNLAQNTTLTPIMQNKLLSLDKKGVNKVLASNEMITKEIFFKLLDKDDDELKYELYQNRVAPQEILQDVYNEGRYNKALAKNENTPIDILYQLQLDRRYERDVKTNAAFGAHIQSENIGWL
jgi:hypothetical protein